MTTEMVVKEIEKRGYNVNSDIVTKNGVEHSAIMIMTEGVNVTPLIYVDNIIADSNGMTVEDIADEVIRIHEKNKMSSSFDLNTILNREFVLNHVEICVQKESDEPIIKRKTQFKGIESYLCVMGSSNKLGEYSIKLNSKLLALSQVSLEEVWEYAKKNTFKKTTIKHLGDVLGIHSYSSDMFVLSNENYIKGASAILNRKFLKKFSKENNISKLLILPSSIHEVIIIPYSDDMNIKFYSDMVASVNATEIIPEERLTDIAYVYEV